MLSREKLLKRTVGRAAGLVLAALLAGGAAQAASVVDFEDWAGVGGHQFDTHWGGYVFAGNFYVGTHPGTNNPTNVLYTSSGGLKFLQETEGIFTLNSIDLQEGFGPGDTVSVTLLGYRPGGPQVMETFNLDGDPATFETFHPASFSGVDQVNFFAYDAQGSPTRDLSIDNIVVPEPATVGLTLVGIAGVGKRRRASV